MDSDDIYQNQIMNLETEQQLSFSQAMIRGAGLAMSHFLHDADAYHELLEEELEDNSVAMKYLKDCRRIVSHLNDVVVAVNSGLVTEDNQERLALRSLISGVVSRFEKIMHEDQSISMEVDDNLFIRGNVYQLQEMFYRYLDDAFTEKMNWYIAGHHVSLSTVEMKQLNSRLPAGEYAMLAISQGQPVQGISAGFYDISENWGRRPLDAGKLQQLLYWSGVAMSYHGCVLEKQQEENEAEIILLLPLAEAWTESPDNQLDFRNNDGQKTILLVDDEDMIWDVINDMLQDMGYQVILAGNGLEAVEIYENNPGAIDLVLLDMIMPEMSGQEAFARLKEIDPDVKVLLSSGYVSGEEVADVMNAGAMGFLKKPYRMTDLARKIHEII